MRSALFQLAILFIFFFIFTRFIAARSRQSHEAQTAMQTSEKEHFLSGYSDEFIALYKHFDDFSHRKPGAALRFIDKTLSMAPPLNKQPLASCITTFFDQCCYQIATPYIPIVFSKVSTISPALLFAMRNGETLAMVNTLLKHTQIAIDSAFDLTSEAGNQHAAQQTAYDVLLLFQLDHILTNSARTHSSTMMASKLHEAMVCAFLSEWKANGPASLETLIAEAAVFFKAKNIKGLASPTQSLDQLLPLWKSQNKTDIQASNLGSRRKYDDFEKYLFALRQRPTLQRSEPAPMANEKTVPSSTTKSKSRSVGAAGIRQHQQLPTTMGKGQTPKAPSPALESLVPEALLPDAPLALPPLAEEKAHQTAQAWQKPAFDTIFALQPQPIVKASSPNIPTTKNHADGMTEFEKKDRTHLSYTPPTIKSSYKRT